MHWKADAVLEISAVLLLLMRRRNKGLILNCSTVDTQAPSPEEPFLQIFTGGYCNKFMIADTAKNSAVAAKPYVCTLGKVE